MTVKVLLDLNVLLDVIQRRDPHYAASARVLSRVARGEIHGALAGHGLTTVYYVVARFSERQRAAEAIDWLLKELDVVPEDRQVFLRARNLAMADFEDAVVAAAAESSGCDYVVTRNVGDFEGSPVQALDPAELEVVLDEGASEA